MFNIVNSVRPVAVLEAPAFFKGNTCQVAVAATAPLTEKDVPLMAAILSTLESNQQRTITEVFRGYQDLSAEELRLKAQQRIRQRAEARSGNAIATQLRLTRGSSAHNRFAYKK